jgi:P-type Cu+ transporter
MKVVDPVCKMTIESEKAAATSDHIGQTIYFCAKICKTKFDAAPEKYLSK